MLLSLKRTLYPVTMAEEKLVGLKYKYFMTRTYIFLSKHCKPFSRKFMLRFINITLINKQISDQIFSKHSDVT
jgi:hypothetical protein